jgi:hypothetical protein
MSTLDLIPSRDDIAGALRQLTGHTEPSANVLAGFGLVAAAILAGAALAVLFTPKPGADLRRDIGARIGGLRDRIAGDGAADSSKAV